VSAQATHYLTPEEYLEIERKAEYKSEYFNGRMWPLGGVPFGMAGGKISHNLIATNMSTALHVALKPRCTVYNSDQRILVSPEGLYTYPDVSVVCGETQIYQEDTVQNPILITEVLSKTTESRDRGSKFAQYRKIESFQEYVLISQTEPRVEVYQRQEGGFWMLKESLGLDKSVKLDSVNCEIPLAEIFWGVKFAASGD
jgi:Uma2 family endonuclease